MATSVKDTIEKIRQRCYNQDCERILFAFSPESKHSGMMDDPDGAVHLIKKALREGWDVTTTAKYIAAHYKTDDTDENVLINRKTKKSGLSTIFNREDRMKEIKNGSISFTSVGNHRVKAHIDGDVFRTTTQKFIDLHKKREAATALYLDTLDVDDLLEFTDKIHQEGLKWPFKQFLTAVLPWWQRREAQSSSELHPVAVQHPYMLALQDRIYSELSS
jgi:hypothetical protein